MNILNIQEKMNQLNKEKNELENKYTQLKSEYLEYITNKEISLMERWDFYVQAPSELKNKNRWLIRPSTKFMKYVVENWFNAPECYGRGKPIYIDQLFGDIVWKGKIYMENVYIDDMTQEDVEKGLEELLSLNLEYFTFNW